MIDKDRLLDLLLTLEERLEKGENVSAIDVCRDCPELIPPVEDRIRALKKIAWIKNPPKTNQLPDSIRPEADPDSLDRYRIKYLISEGGYGRVFLAQDEQLKRFVAIKVPRQERLSRHDALNVWRTEAHTVASLDHPNIVPIYDVGSTADCPCYIVSKFIDGTDLATRLKKSRLSITVTVELVATIAEALHYAHQKGFVHRDIKPSNILIDLSGKFYVADFGIALKEEDFGKGIAFLGTPSYMSPEQAQGEGHRVDGRSDIFSLGVVFYEALVGRKPFQANSDQEQLDQLIKVDARPPRQVDDSIPKELEYICLKALAKRASERYTTAKDMADDLRHFLQSATANEKTLVRNVPVEDATPSRPILGAIPMTASDPGAAKVVPKGLRSFDANDADFFLELLPGPRDRDGLTDSIRFWKNRIETTDPANTFAVGIIYGPSGCGKSSLVKAGLLPRLSNDVLAVYIEATAADTEERLLKELRKRCPDVPKNLGLIEALTVLRRDQGISVGKKFVIILDQFEQWLQAKHTEKNTELVQALRQCDGERVQCIVMVRDDFGMSATRFMAAVDIPIVQGRNFATVDRFDLLHARKVLAEFGRAFGRLPDNLSRCSKIQDAFLDQVVSGLAQEGKVISVRLALFAEMIKGKPWTPATLKEVGGMDGVGATFLEDNLAASTAPPQNRRHQFATQAVLKTLLPETGTDIKGHRLSQQALLEASGYANRRRDFEDVLRILDSDLRLITPTEFEGRDEADLATAPACAKYYQLTHDYLVHSLREWLTRKQKETRRGRTELLLADRAGIWNARQENRQLPSLWQWLSIRWLTAKTTWTQPQSMMMQKAKRYHGVRCLVAILLLSLLGWGFYQGHGRMQALALRDRLLDANTMDVPTIVADLAPYRQWIDPMLHDAAAKAEASKDVRKQLHVSLALLPVDASQIKYLYRRLLDAEPHQVPVIRDALAKYKDELLSNLWFVVETPEKGKESQRLRAACALATYDPNNQKWAKVQEAVGNDLVTVPSVYLSAWMDSLRPVRGKMIDPLATIYKNASRRDVERSLATDVLADYASDQPETLADLVMSADVRQFAVIFPKLKEHGEEGCSVLCGEIDRAAPVSATDGEKEKLAKRQANAAVALLRMNHEVKVWPLLKHSPDSRVRSYLIHRLIPMGANAKLIAERLSTEPDLTVRRALILSLGADSERGLSTSVKDSYLPTILDLYRTAADPGIHASAEWLLRTWKEKAKLKQLNEAWAIDQEGREKRLSGIKQLLMKDKERTPPQWYVNSQGQTMVVIPGPTEFVMGSPKTEVGRKENEAQHKRRIGRTFSIATKPVTVEQYRRFDTGYKLPPIFTRLADLPVVGINWYKATEYCNWLSKEEGIPEDQWCYEIKGNVTALKAKYLSLHGYRLPTEAEVEYATRAGASTSRYYGETDELLPMYAWYLNNSKEHPRPVGSLKPNDLGMFDVHGNVFIWCQERYGAYRTDLGGNMAEDREDRLEVSDLDARVLRGSPFAFWPSNVRSANRSSNLPTFSSPNYGFRPARTF